MYLKDNKHKILNLHYIWVNYMCKMHKKNVLKYYIKSFRKKMLTYLSFGVIQHNAEHIYN